MADQSITDALHEAIEAAMRARAYRLEIEAAAALLLTEPERWGHLTVVYGPPLGDPGDPGVLACEWPDPLPWSPLVEPGLDVEEVRRKAWQVLDEAAARAAARN